MSRIPTQSAVEQRRILNHWSERLSGLPRFRDRLAQSGIHSFETTGIEILQVNVGKLCNQSCHHCHVDAGPTRREVMERSTFEECLRALESSGIRQVDITGGAPEMNPHFRWFVEECRKLGRHVLVRCNLTILLAGKDYRDLPEFYARNQVEVISSLPHYSQSWTDRQRGDHVFEKSIRALQMLNAVGYARHENLRLNLVTNPVGVFLPGDQASLEQDFKRELKSRFDIDFDRLFTITNMPISRFLEALLKVGKLEDYLEKLVQAFNSQAALGVMCRNTLSVGWDGLLYDCDFNQMLEIPVLPAGSRHIRDFSHAMLNRREIALDQHCYGCTAGSGSSCGGATV